MVYYKHDPELQRTVNLQKPEGEKSSKEMSLKQVGIGETSQSDSPVRLETVTPASTYPPTQTEAESSAKVPASKYIEPLSPPENIPELTVSEPEITLTAVKISEPDGEKPKEVAHHS